MYPNHSDMQLKAAQASGLIGAASHDSMNQMPKRDEPPVAISMQGLFERLGQLQAEVDQLTERLAPVSRPEMKGTGEGSSRAPSECAVVDMLDQAAERVEREISRLSIARNRLCI